MCGLSVGVHDCLLHFHLSPSPVHHSQVLSVLRIKDKIKYFYKFLLKYVKWLYTEINKETKMYESNYSEFLLLVCVYDSLVIHSTARLCATECWVCCRSDWGGQSKEHCLLWFYLYGETKDAAFLPLFALKFSNLLSWGWSLMPQKQWVDWWWEASDGSRQAGPFLIFLIRILETGH